MPAWSYKYIFPEDLSLTTTEYQEILAQKIIPNKSPLATATLEAQIRIKAGLFVYKGISKSSNINVHFRFEELMDKEDLYIFKTAIKNGWIWPDKCHFSAVLDQDTQRHEITVTLSSTDTKSDEKLENESVEESFTDKFSPVNPMATSLPPLHNLALTMMPLPVEAFKISSERIIFDIQCKPPKALSTSDSRHAMLVEIINTLASSLLISLAGGVDPEIVQFVRHLFPHVGLPGTPSAPAAIKDEVLDQIVSIMGQYSLPIAGTNQTEILANAKKYYWQSYSFRNNVEIKGMMLNLDGNYNPAVTAVAPTAMPKAPPTFVSAQKKTQRSLFSQAQVDHYSLLIDADEGRTVNLNDEVMKKDDNDNSGEIDEILDHT